MNYIANGTAIDTLLYGLQGALLGMGTVFSVLILLWLVLMVFQFIFSPKKKTESTQSNAVVDKAPVAVAPPVVESVACEEDETELIAVIMAAVYAASGAVPGTLRMVSCKRQKTPWNRK